MRLSLRRKIIAMLFILVLLLIFISYFVNVLVVKEYYYFYKKNSFSELYDRINSISLSKDDKLHINQELNDLCELQNITLLIVDERDDVVFNYGNEDLSYQCLIENQNESDALYTSVEKVAENEEYNLQISQLKSSKSSYYEMYGKLDNGNRFIVRAMYSQRVDNTNLNNRVYTVLTAIMIIIVAIMLYIISSFITRPIKDLSDISKKIMDDDFEAKYTGNRKDEIDVIGNNMNELSEKLKNTIAELKSANLELQKDIDEKTQIDEQRKEFLSNVSHELKTPIALIQGYAEGLKEDINDDAESRDYYCDVIIDESKKMNNIVKKLLSLNQIEFGNYHVNMERFDIVEVIKGMLYSSGLFIKQKHINVFFDDTKSVFVWADEFQIEEVINNFVSNAINHVSGEMEIRIDVKKIENGKARISVFNTGNPIPEESLENLWDKFYKVDKARTREYGGSGLGLSIVKAIMESMNQKYGVENKENGVEFWFELECKNDCK